MQGSFWTSGRINSNKYISILRFRFFFIKFITIFVIIISVIKLLCLVNLELPNSLSWMEIPLLSNYSCLIRDVLLRRWHTRFDCMWDLHRLWDVFPCVISVIIGPRFLVIKNTSSLTRLKKEKKKKHFFICTYALDWDPEVIQMVNRLYFQTVN